MGVASVWLGVVAAFGSVAEAAICRFSHATAHIVRPFPEDDYMSFPLNLHCPESSAEVYPLEVSRHTETLYEVTVPPELRCVLNMSGDYFQVAEWVLDTAPVHLVDLPLSAKGAYQRQELRLVEMNAQFHRVPTPISHTTYDTVSIGWLLWSKGTPPASGLRSTGLSRMRIGSSTAGAASGLRVGPLGLRGAPGLLVSDALLKGPRGGARCVMFSERCSGKHELYIYHTEAIRCNLARTLSGSPLIEWILKGAYMNSQINGLESMQSIRPLHPVRKYMEFILIVHANIVPEGVRGLWV